MSRNLQLKTSSLIFFAFPAILLYCTLILSARQVIAKANIIKGHKENVRRKKPLQNLYENRLGRAQYITHARLENEEL